MSEPSIYIIIFWSEARAWAEYTGESKWAVLLDQKSQIAKELKKARKAEKKAKKADSSTISTTEAQLMEDKWYKNGEEVFL